MTTDTRDPRKKFGLALVECAEKNPIVVALSADSSSGSGMTPFREKFPERHIEFGIMEQGILGFASGLATTGKIPVIAAIAPFVSARPFEMFKVDLGYMRQNVKVVGRCAGISYSDLGGTHQSLEDVAILRTIPNVTVLCPGDPIEITKAVSAMLDHDGPVYMRIGKQEMPLLYDDTYDYKIGKADILKSGNDVTIISNGTVLSKAKEACETLAKRGISARLLNMHTVKPIDIEAIKKAAEETGKIVTVEEHFLFGGLGSAVAEVCAAHCPVPVKMIGVDDIFASNGPYEELLGLYGLQGEQIADTVESFIGGLGGSKD